MIIPDINLLLYAYDAGSSFHAKAPDTDLSRFGGLRGFNPIPGLGSSSQRRAKGA